MDYEENAEPKFCRICGKALKPGAAFCTACGTKIAVNEEKNDVADAMENTANSGDVYSSGENISQDNGTAVFYDESQNEEAATDNNDGFFADDEPVYVQDENGDIISDAEDPSYGAEDDSIEAPEDEDDGRDYIINENPVNYEQEIHTAKNGDAQKKQEFKAEGSQKKEKVKKEGKKVSLLWSILISAGMSVLAVVVTIVIMFFWKAPVSKDSIVGNLIEKYSESGSSSSSKTKPSEEVAEKEDKTVNGETIPAGSDVTINISGDSTDLAAAIYAKCEESVVGIRIMQSSSSTPWSQATFQTYGEGSGVVYKEDGYIITNCHVVEDALDEDGNVSSDYEIRVFLDKSLEKYYVAEVVGVDSTTDLAVIKINVTGLTPIEFADSSEVSIGETVFTLGSPGGLEFMNSIADGIVSGVNKNLTTSSGYAYDLIQTTATINPGNSGGALLNKEGKLVGICALKIVSSSYENMCFAIASDTVAQISKTLLENGKVDRAQLGVSISTSYTAESASESNLPSGAYVYAVTEDGAADKAGIEAGSIITELDGETVSDFFSLRSLLSKYSAGDTVKVKAYVYDKNDPENGEYKEYSVTLQGSTD